MTGHTSSDKDKSSIMNYQTLLTYGSLFFFIYLFVSSIVLIKDSATILGESGALQILNTIKDPTTAAFAGWFCTALIQSSGAFDSIVVSLVSANILPLSTAVSTLIGAEVGTTITAQLTSVLGYMRKDRDVFKSSFFVALIHYFYNISTLLIALPLEVFFGFFSSIANVGSTFFSKIPGIASIPSLLNLVTPWIDLLLSLIPAWLGFVGGVALLIFALMRCEKYMSATFATERSQKLLQTTFGSPYRAFLSGLAFTIVVPSTSVMVSLLVPLAATGIIGSSHHILPYILGSNVGTVFDVMLAALATGDPTAIGVWLVHLTINIIGAFIFLLLSKPFTSFINEINTFFTSSRKRVLLFLGLSNGIPFLILVLGLIA
ncbi:MAG: hypothetical protein ACXAEX_22900 [Promethearchaeota archaeon]